MTYKALLDRLNEFNDINDISTPIQSTNDQNKEVNSFISLMSYDRKYPSWPCVLCGGSRFRLATPPNTAWICEDCVPRRFKRVYSPLEATHD